MSALACDMTALNADQRKRHQEVLKEIHKLRLETQELSDGYAFRFTSDTETLMRVAEFITLERLCCPFLNFQVEVVEDGGPTWLRLTGEPGVKEFLVYEIGV